MCSVVGEVTLEFCFCVWGFKKLDVILGVFSEARFEENLKNVGYQPNLYTTNLMQEISILIPRLKYLGNLFWPT